MAEQGGDDPGGDAEGGPARTDGDGGTGHEARLDALEARLASARATRTPRSRGEEHFSQANIAWRMVIELVSGLGIGFGIGYGLDVLFGTMPVLLVLFLLLGFAAGVKTMLRTAAELQTKQTAADAAEDEGK